MKIIHPKQSMEKRRYILIGLEYVFYVTKKCY